MSAAAPASLRAQFWCLAWGLATSNVAASIWTTTLLTRSHTMLWVWVNVVAHQFWPNAPSPTPGRSRTASYVEPPLLPALEAWASFLPPKTLRAAATVAERVTLTVITSSPPVQVHSAGSIPPCRLPRPGMIFAAWSSDTRPQALGGVANLPSPGGRGDAVVVAAGLGGGLEGGSPDGPFDGPSDGWAIVRVSGGGVVPVEALTRSTALTVRAVAAVRPASTKGSLLLSRGIGIVAIPLEGPLDGPVAGSVG